MYFDDTREDRPRSSPHLAASLASRHLVMDLASNGERLELADVADARELVEVINRSYRPVHIVLEQITGLALAPRIDLQGLLTLLAESVVLIMRDLGTRRIIGCVALTPETDFCWDLSILATDVDRQGKGTGHRLLQAAEGAVWSAEARTIRLSVVDRKPDLIAWYARMGYVETGEHEAFPFEPPIQGPPPLTLVVMEKARPAAQLAAGG